MRRSHLQGNLHNHIIQRLVTQSDLAPGLVGLEDLQNREFQTRLGDEGADVQPRSVTNDRLERNDVWVPRISLEGVVQGVVELGEDGSDVERVCAKVGSQNGFHEALGVGRGSS